MAEALVSRIIEQLASIAGLGEAVQSLLSNFQAIEPVLEDAECRQVNETAVRHWLLKLKDTSNDIDDVLDEWNTGMKEVENAYKNSRKVRSLNLCNGFCYRPVVPHYDIAVKIKNLSKTLDDIAREKDRFSFSLTSGTRELKPPMTTSVIDVSKVHVRDEEKNTIIDLLLGRSSQEKMSLPIISIVGTGGIGKTTLARLVFNEVKVDARFDKRIWVCFSDPVDEIRVAKAILESFRDVVPAVAAFDTLLRHIEKSVKGKKLLLVLDDVWSGNPTKWEELVSTLKFGSPESRILVTTRKEDVAKIMRTTSMILLAKLPDNDCWSLFSQIAFSGRTTEECQKLTDIGRMIADKCNGLPLAAKTSGSLLSLKTTMEQWKTVLDSEIWKVEDVEKGLLPPLVISYFDLPSIVRRCFSYCAIFPKGYEINKDHLIKLWMAQGYLKVEGREDMELIGQDCFENLATRSFFQDFERSEYDGSIISCKMHDILHDFAQFLAQPMCNETKSRSLSIVHKSNSSTKFPGIRDSVTDIALPSLFDRLTCLRTLCLRCHERNFCLSIARLPRKIKKLKHLSYLNLSNNDAIYELPEALCDLCNLQTLDVSNCGNLHALPQGIAKLINLRHLINEGTPLLYLPKGLERLTCLRTLSEFTVSDIENVSKAGSLQCLQNLNHRQGSLVLTTLGNVTDVGEAKSAKLESKKHLVCLRLEFIKLGRVELVDKDNEVLEALQPSPDLEKLTICDYKSKIISPSWLMPLTELRMLNLQCCGKCEQLPSLGRLPSLESLVVEALSSVRRVGNEFLGIESDDISLSSSSVVFPKLKFLEFRDMDEWEEWDYVISGQKDTKIMPRLHRLKLDGCHKLKALPDHLLLTIKMNELTMNWCSVLKERYGRTGDWRYKVSHIPNSCLGCRHQMVVGRSGQSFYYTNDL